MKVLFVCWQNVSRSQMAAAYYNYLTHSHNADSAGTEVELPGETLLERRNRLGGTVGIELLAQDGIDISASKKTQLTPDMLDKYDYIISMANKEVTPDWLENHTKYVFWQVKDPGAKNISIAAEVRDDVKAKVEEFLAAHNASSSSNS